MADVPTAQGRGVAVIGDALVDVMVELGGERAFPGGAGLNVAVGVARHGVPALIAYPVVMDDQGTDLLTFLESEGVGVVPLPGGLESAVARSWVKDGETQYEFSEAVHNRRYVFPADAVERLADAAAIAVSSFPIGSQDQVDALLALVRTCDVPMAVDANARASLLPQVESYRDGFLRLARAATLVKVSREDMNLLFFEGADAAVGHLRTLGSAVVVVTDGARGATVYAGDVTVHASPPHLDLPIVTTIGAGDALFASLVRLLGTAAWPLSEASWDTALGDAVAFASAACRVAGGVPPMPTFPPNPQGDTP